MFVKVDIPQDHFESTIHGIDAASSPTLRVNNMPLSRKQHQAPQQHLAAYRLQHRWQTAKFF